jgi:type IV pilus assembly protein PilQ
MQHIIEVGEKRPPENLKFRDKGTAMITMRLTIVVVLAVAFASVFASTEAASDEVPALEAATMLQSVGVRQEPERIVSLVEGDGAFRYEVSLYNDNRLVLDLLDVGSEIIERVIPVDHPLLHRIRIGLHHGPKKMTRLVYDLKDKVKYSVVPIGRRLVVTLHESVPAPQDVATKSSLPLPENTLPEGEPPPSVVVQEATAEENVEAVPLVGRVVLKSKTSRYAGRRISLDFQSADLRSVLRMLAEVSGRNMVIGEAVSGKVAIRLLNVPWDQGLDVIMRMHSLGKVEWGKVIFIDTQANITQQKEEELRKKDMVLRVKETELSTQELVTELIPVNYADIGEMASIVADQLSMRGEIKQDSRTKTLIVRDIDEKIHNIRELVRKIDTRTPQVLIEARIVQANRAFARSLGIQWGVRQATANPTNPFVLQSPLAGSAFGVPTEDFLVNLPAQLSSASTIGFTYGKLLGDLFTLDMRLSAGETLALANVVSSPKIVTLDNKKAVIQQGTQIPFETTSLQGTQTTFIDAALVLEVEPHVIVHDDTISLKITTTKNSVGTLTFDAGPTIDTKEAQTEVLVKNGETIVIGGILEETKTDTSAGIPYLSKIPVLGWLFKNKSITVVKTELLIFLTPSITQ